MTTLRLEHIGKIYGKNVEAVKNFSMEIEEGEFIILVGPSGCGKSTTLRMIAGLESITGGNLYLDGERINEVSEKERDMAMIFQNYALYPHMTVYENMAFGLRMRKTEKAQIDKIVTDTAKVLNLEHLLKRKPKALSGGEKQRVAMGRAIVRNPRVFLMDEPLSNLDAKLRVQMRSEISKLHRRLGTTVIYVTHDQVEAMTLGTRIVVMNQGEIQQIGTPENIYDYPCNIFTAGFIGTPQMNFIEGEVIRKGTLYVLSTGECLFPLPQNAGMEDCFGKKVILGIRPEDITICTEESESAAGIIQRKEMAGAEVYLYIKIKDTGLTLRAPRQAYCMGKEIKVRFNPDKIHLFDKNTEERIHIERRT